MLITMRQSLRLQHAGAELPLTAGSTYDVADVVGRSLLESGAATRAPMQAPETKRKRAA